MDALVMRSLSGQEFRLLLLVIRKTYGFSKKQDFISLTQMAKLTGMSRIRCSQVVNSLESKKLLTVTQNINGLTKEYKFNKDFDEWITIKKKCNRIGKVKRTVKENCNHKRNIYKRKECPPEILTLSELLAQRILQNNPRHRELSNGKSQDCVIRWAADIDKLHRLDKQTVEDIRMVIEWCQADSFWKKNILSGAKLREQWDQLYPQAIEKKGKQSRPAVTRNMAEIIAKGKEAMNAS